MLISCCLFLSSTNPSEENDLSKYDLKGKVKFLSVRLFEAKYVNGNFIKAGNLEGPGVDTGTEFYDIYFNEYGLISEESKYYLSGVLSQKKKFKYNMSNQITDEIFQFTGYNKENSYHYTYNKDGLNLKVLEIGLDAYNKLDTTVYDKIYNGNRLEKCIVTYGYSGAKEMISYVYDGGGRKIEEIGKGYRIKFEYENNLLFKEIKEYDKGFLSGVKEKSISEYNSSGFVVKREFYENGTLISCEIKEYDHSKKILLEKFSYSKNMVLVEHAKYDYNLNGHLVSNEHEYFSGIYKGNYYKTVFVRDSLGNCLQELEFDKEGNVRSSIQSSFDNFGNLLQTIERNEQHEVVKVIRFKYDLHNNWVEKVNFSPIKERGTMVERRIIYYS